MANAGEEGSVVVNNVRLGKGDYGYNAREDKYENMKESGIIDPAKVPTHRYTPSYRKNAFMGCAAGLLLAVVYVTLLYLMDVRIKNEEDLTQLFDLPMLGQIPSFAENERKKAGLSAQKADEHGGER